MAFNWGAGNSPAVLMHDALRPSMKMVDPIFTSLSLIVTANALLVLQPPTGAPTTSSYDATGNRTVDNMGGVLTTYTWDGENRLVGVVSAATGVQTYAYNAWGKRVLNNTAACLVTSTWDEENIIVESSSTASLAGQYTDYPGWWGGLTQQQSGGASQFYIFDPMGNTRLLVDSSNTVVKQYAFKAFGEQLASSGSALSVFGYGGQVGYYQDASTRLYVRARYLDTAKGRWWSRDPIGFAGEDWNLYRYGNNNPTLYVDPSGLNGYRYGPVPSSYDCTSPGPGIQAVIWNVTLNGLNTLTNGDTDCDLTKGLPWTIVCASKAQSGCGFREIYAHEMQHQADIRSCCQKASQCVKARGLATCTNLWANWRNANRAWLECRASTVAYGPCIYQQGSECADELAIVQALDLANLNNYNCFSQFPDPLNAPMPVKCPF